MEAAPRPKGQGVDDDEWRRRPALRGRVLMEAVVGGGRGRRVLMGLPRPEDGVLMMGI